MAARSKRDVSLSTPTARARLKALPNRKPHWWFISQGCYLGYRRHAGNSDLGTWCARWYDKVRGVYREQALGTADDKAPANGEDVFTFAQALGKAQAWCEQQERKALGLPGEEEKGPYTVGRCLDDYLAWFEVHRESGSTTRYVIDAHIRPEFAELEVSRLTAQRVKRWHQELAKKPPRLRSKKGEGVRFAPMGEDAEAQRRRKATANRVLSILKAALNHAYADGRVASDAGWSSVRPFRRADQPKVRFLDKGEATRLLNSCPADFRSLVEAALLTGCRYGELRRATVSHYRRSSRSLWIPASKSGKERDVFLSDQGVAFFESRVAGRLGADLIFLREDREPWKKSHQHRRMIEVSRLAKLVPPVSFHVLRHTYASHYLMNRGSITGLQAQLGHADPRMTVRQYGHLAATWRQAEARNSALRIGAASPRTAEVVPLVPAAR